MHPGLLLVLTLLIIGIGVFLLWPGNGLMARWSRARLNTQRVLLEDALKYLFDCEYKSIACSLNSIAGNLNISTDQAAKLMDRLRTMGLIAMRNHDFELTDTGRSYALRVIRVHRIWERYLADETGLGHSEWHRSADLKEHQMTTEAANRLAAQIGNPVFDPHGDPIPTTAGELPAYSGLSLSHLKEGDQGRILHIEDEPGYIYEQLVALGLYPGQLVYVIHVADDKITFAADGEECVLTPLFASGITVEKLAEPAKVHSKARLLSALVPGESATVLAISPHCRGQQRRRLMDLGIIPGTKIAAVLQSASGDPMGYRILGATIGIRKSQSDLIYVSE